MNGYLLLVTLGPVQDFITQARRTRDLWFGSHLLSEMSRAVAADLAERGAKLIFPALDRGDPELEDSSGPLRPSGTPPLAIPNKLLVEVPKGLDPELLAQNAREAAKGNWRGLAKAVEHRCYALIAPGAREAWREQLDTFLEFGAAWAPLPEDKDKYAETRSELEREMAARKLLRDFPAWKEQRGAVPKSSLDGGRETVIVERDKRPAGLVKRYRIAPGEQLDAVGLVKRAGGDPGQFVPIANVALAAWIAAAKQRFPDKLRGVAEACEREGFGRVLRSDLACARAFEFDAEVFLRDRWTALLEEARGRRPKPDEVRSFGRGIKPLLDKMNEPNSYVACLVADGDHMGRALDHVRDVQAHRAFSKRLSHFAGQARKIVEQDHRGILVYAGGDNVLAFINVAEALPCAEALCVAFTELIKDALSNERIGVDLPTLSVGIGIGHLLESMGQLRRLGGDAEKLAKTRRNALAVLLDKRSGGTTRLCESWAEQPVARLRSAAAMLETNLSMKKVHEIQHDLQRMPSQNTLLPGEQAAWADLLRKDVERTLARTSDGEGVSAGEVGLSWNTGESYDARREVVTQWLSGMMIAKAVAEATAAAGPKEGR